LDTSRTAVKSNVRKRALNGQPAVTLTVSKQSGQNTVAVADAVKERLAEIASPCRPELRPKSSAIQSIFIRRRSVHPKAPG